MNLIAFLEQQLLNPTVKSVKPSIGLHPSAASIKIGNEIFGGCHRAEYWRFKGKEQSNPDSAQSLMKMKMGDAAHDCIAEICVLERLVDGREKDIWIPEHHVHGRCDLIIADSVNNNKIVVEIKSVWGYNGCQEVILPAKGVLKPKIEHVLQNGIYLAFYSQFGMEEGILLYVSRDNGAYNQHSMKLIPVDGGIGIQYQSGIEGEWKTYPGITLEGIFARFDELWNFIQLDTLPSRDYAIQYSQAKCKELCDAQELNKADTAMVQADRFIEKGDWHCSYCRYKSSCWEGISGPDLWSGAKTKAD